MHAARVEMRDGRVLCGPLWSWRPAEGWFSLVDEECNNGGKPVVVRLSDVEDAVLRAGRGAAGAEGEDVDLLARARREGWRP